ncbi:hypothetical protein [Microbacterium sp. T2.11-28]|uniref:hypothetical protein n=1 Tax=Microbacterium sp. T2.11-28 TaxID=3041169 RepID=UPI0024773960|nr:hypothetical protein [Microbacterium sp. T2.11-28]CAI9390553.1 hypothetical protein MICABA_01497 [Microbacterium sp. T2.11-28]
MARVGGRSTSLAWVVGLACVAVVGALAWIAAPLLPGTVQFVGDQLNPPTSGPAAGDGDEASSGEMGECRDLYADALWTALVWTPDAVLTPSTDAPESSASGLLDALSPRVRFTCSWTSAEGAISTTLADVPADAGAIARTALPALGFACDAVDDRTRCIREGEDGARETIEAGRGVWLSSVQDGWQPAGYAERIADRVWTD